MGIGAHNEARNKVAYTLSDFTNKKIHAYEVGDYHSLLIASGCNCVDSIEGSAKGCQGIQKCNGGADIYSWGHNTHSQVLGYPTEEPVGVPKIVPYFNMNKNVAISHIAVSRSRNVAVSNQTMEVFEWGYRLGEDSDAMQ